MPTAAYIIYTIKEKDTLKSLAERLGIIDYRQLLDFHNSIATKEEKITSNQLAKGTKIFIPDLEEIKHINSKIKVPKENEQNKDKIETKINLSLKNITGNYEVVIKKENKTKEKPVSIRYTLEVNYLGKEEEYNILKITKKEYKINQELPQKKIEKLALQCAKNYYPIEFYIKEKGEKIEIKNIKEIQERWKKNRPEIETYYTGEIVEKYLNNVEKKLSHPKYLAKALQEDIALETLFLPYFKIHHVEEKNYTTEITKDKIKTKITHYFQEAIETENNYNIIQEGTVIDSRNYKQILIPDLEENSTNPKIEGELLHTTNIDKQTKKIQSIDAIKTIKYTENTVKTTKVKIRLI